MSPKLGINYGIGLKFRLSNKIGLNLEPHINQFKFDLDNDIYRGMNLNIPLNFSYEFHEYNDFDIDDFFSFHEIMGGAYYSKLLNIKNDGGDILDNFENTGYGLTAGITFHFLFFHFKANYYHNLATDSKENFVYKPNYVALNIIFPFEF